MRLLHREVPAILLFNTSYEWRSQEVKNLLNLFRARLRIDSIAKYKVDLVDCQGATKDLIGIRGFTGKYFEYTSNQVHLSSVQYPLLR